MKLSAGDLNRLITIEKPLPHGSFTGAGRVKWVEVGKAWAQVQDKLPSRGEREENGFITASRPARVRMRYRTDITTDMRFKLGDRIMQIISGPAELGNRQWLEVMVEDYSPAGGFPDA